MVYAIGKKLRRDERENNRIGPRDFGWAGEDLRVLLVAGSSWFAQILACAAENEGR